MSKKIQFLFVAIFFALTLTVTQSAFAKTTKPGWGFGDDNHTHVGPPGKSDRFDDKDDNNQGDENGDDHHVGPPGKSDRFDNDSDNDQGNNELRLFILHWTNLFVGFQRDLFSHLKDR